MNRTVILAYLLLSSILCFPQNSFHGIVKDQLTAERVNDATIILENGDSIIATRVSDMTGEFVFNDLYAGIYRLSVVHENYFNIHDSIVMGKVSLKKEYTLSVKKDISLNEIIIEVDRGDIVSSRADGTMFYLSSKGKESKDVYDALTEIPKLNIDLSSKSITLNDGSSPMVLINGVPSYSSLSNIDPKNIESVEVIETAKSKYLTDNTNSIINIKVKKEKSTYNYLNTGAKHNPQLIYGYSDLNYENGSNKYSVYFSGQHFYFHNNKSHINTIQQANLKTKRHELDKKMDYATYNFSLGGDYSISEKDYLSFTTTYLSTPEDYKYWGTGSIEEIKLSAISFYSSKKNKKRHSLNTNNLYYKHTFDASKYLEILFRFNYNKSQDYIMQNEQGDFDYYYNNEADFKNTRKSGILDIYYFFNKSIGIGSRTDTRYDNINQDIIVSGFKYNEWNEYLYADISKNINDKFSYMLSAGITFLNNHVNDVKHTYINPKYALSLNYKHNHISSFRLSSNYYTQSPNIRLMSPYNTSTESLVVTSGNPHLKPYKPLNFSLSYSYSDKSFYFEPKVQYTRLIDAVMHQSVEEDGIYYQMPQNYKYNQLLTLSLVARYNIKNWGYIHLSPIYNKMFLYGDKAHSYFRGNLNLNLYYKKMSFYGYCGLPVLSYTHNNKFKSSPESEITLTWNLSEQLALSGGARYITGKQTFESWTYDDNYSAYSSDKYESRNWAFLLGFRFNFRNNNKSKREQKKLLQSEEGINLIQIN